MYYICIYPSPGWSPISMAQRKNIDGLIRSFGWSKNFSHGHMKYLFSRVINIDIDVEHPEFVDHVHWKLLVLHFFLYVCWRIYGFAWKYDWFSHVLLKSSVSLYIFPTKMAIVRLYPIIQTHPFISYCWLVYVYIYNIYLFIPRIHIHWLHTHDLSSPFSHIFAGLWPSLLDVPPWHQQSRHCPRRNRSWSSSVQPKWRPAWTGRAWARRLWRLSMG